MATDTPASRASVGRPVSSRNQRSTSTACVAQEAARAPIPVPRRNIWCVGRNYHAHAKELQASVFKNNAADPTSWPIVFTKVPETVRPEYRQGGTLGDDRKHWFRAKFFQQYRLFFRYRAS